LAVPVIVGQLAQIGMTIVDNVLAGHLGARILGSVAVGGSLYVLMLMLVIGIMMSLQPTVAALDGAGRRSEASPLFRQAVLLGLSVGAIAGAGLALAGPPVLHLVGIAPSLQPGATEFLHAIAAAGPALGLFAAARGLSEGLSRTLPTLVVQFAGLLVLAPLAWALMYGRLGAPPLGPLGSGLATAIAAWVQALAYIAYVRFSPTYRGLDWTLGRWRPQPHLLLPLLRVGIPIAVSFLMEAGMFSAAGLIVGGLGEQAVAANQVALSLVTVTFMVPLGLALAVTVRVGRAVGAGNAPAVRTAAIVGFTLVLATQLASATLLVTLPRTLVSLYVTDPIVIGLGASLLAVGALFQLSDGIQVLANGALRGLKDTTVPMLITTASYWGVGVPVGAILALALHWGPLGMWVGMLSGLTPAAIMLTVRFLRLTAPRPTPDSA
jgi:MATE family multidrug resistance protein